MNVARKNKNNNNAIKLYSNGRWHQNFVRHSMPCGRRRRLWPDMLPTMLAAILQSKEYNINDILFIIIIIIILMMIIVAYD